MLFSLNVRQFVARSTPRFVSSKIVTSSRGFRASSSTWTSTPTGTSLILGESSPPWDLSRYTSTSRQVLSPDSNDALIVLNYRLPDNLSLYFHTKGVKIAADGGLRHLHEIDTKLIPDFAVGDFDSASEKLLEEYKSKGVHVIDGRHDQDSTDLEKALLVLELEEVARGKAHDKILIIGGLGGNLSHQFANINSLFKYKHRDIVLVGRDNLAVLVHQQRKIHFDHPDVTFCSLIPVGHPAKHVTTTGLKWNLASDPLEFGKLVSTSNELESKDVTISTDSPVLFVVDLKH